MPAHGGDTVTGALGGEVFLGKDLACLNLPCGHDALAGNGLVGGLAGGQVLVAVPERRLHMAHGLDHCLELGGVEAGLLVRAGQGFIEREVLFNDLRAQHGGGHIALPPGGVIGQADRQAELLIQLDHRGQVGVLIRGGILGVAVQDRDFRAAAVIQHAKCIGDLVKAAHAGGEQDRRFQRGHCLQIRQVRDLARGDLEQRQPQRAEEPDAGQIERCREILDADGVAVFLQLPVGIE